MRTPFDLLTMALLCTLGLLGSPANAALIPFSPVDAGEVHETITLGLTPSQPFNFSYRHHTGLDELRLSSEVGFGPPPHTSGDFANRNHGYLVYDLSALSSPVTNAFLEIALTATGGNLGHLTITLLGTLSAADLANLPAGPLSEATGRSLMSDLANTTAGRMNLQPGSAQFDIALNTAGRNAINNTSTLMALGIAYSPTDPLYNANIALAGAPILHVETAAVAAPPTVPLMGFAWLIALRLSRRLRDADGH